MPALLYGIRLWTAVCLALFVAFWLELDSAFWAGTPAAIVCHPVLGASLRKGWFRMVGTVIGAIAAVVLSALFPQSRPGFLLGLAMWAGVCALVATLLRNFASYAAAMSGFTAAIIAGNELGAVGGANGDAFNLAVARATETWIGIVCAGVVLASTDLGGTRRRLATLLASLSADVAGGLTRALQLPASRQAESRMERRRLVMQVSGLSTVIDQAAGEISDTLFRPRAILAAADSLIDALVAWRSVADHQEFHPDAAAQAPRVRECLPTILTTSEGAIDPARWRSDPLGMRAAMRTAARRLVALPAETASLRLLCDSTAEGLLALSRALTGVVRVGHPALTPRLRRTARLRVPDLMPALINGVRAFLAVGAAALIWTWTAWPNGATLIVFAMLAMTLFAPREDAAYATARSFMTGVALTAVFAAVVGFALLPHQTSFAGFCAVLGLVLVPAGALSAQSWEQSLFVGLTALFIPLLGPSNPETYDPSHFYNMALPLVSGIALAMLAMRLMPPMPPAMRARRLLALTLRDVRRFTQGKVPPSSVEWAGKMYSRFSALPDSVDILQGARLAAALSMGSGIIRLRRIAHRFGLDAELRGAMAAIAAGDSAAGIQELDRFERALADLPPALPGARLRLRARGSILCIADVLNQHSSYFDARVGA
ncbi:MAG: FUSC family protein [Acetobacteraceae bacterium]